MNKILAIFALIALSLALFACGRDKNKTTAAPATTTTMQTTRTTESTMVTSATATTPHTTETTKESSHPTETGGTTASDNARRRMPHDFPTPPNGTMPEHFTMPPTGTAPGGSTSVR